MKVKAKVSFSGILTMSKGQTADLPENETLEDLMNAGYVETVEPQSDTPTAPTKREAKKGAKGKTA